MEIVLQSVESFVGFKIGAGMREVDMALCVFSV